MRVLTMYILTMSLVFQKESLKKISTQIIMKAVMHEHFSRILPLNRCQEKALSQRSRSHYLKKKNCLFYWRDVKRRKLVFLSRYY
jgi:hypothetical protein